MDEGERDVATRPSTGVRMTAKAGLPAGISDLTASPTRGRPFVKGHSGNPRGRPKRDQDIAALARAYTLDAIAILASTMADPRTPPATRVMAANALLDRGYGRPPQALQVERTPTIGEEFDAFIRQLQDQREAERGQQLAAGESGLGVAAIEGPEG